MQVLKFGGSSVANATNINKVISIIRKAVKRDRTIAVSSAISGCTDSLIAIGKKAVAQDPFYAQMIRDLEKKHMDLIKELIPGEDSEDITNECKRLFGNLTEICKGIFYLKELTPLSLDHIESFGELLSTKIISAKLKSMNISHLWKDSRDLIKTGTVNGKNSVLEDITFENIGKFFSDASHDLYIMPGFIARDLEGRTTTLGRGGSDYTASLLAVGISARVLEIWTDVCGMMTADPRTVKEAYPIRNISYTEALELSHFGAKVVYPPTIQPVVKQGIPIYVKNTFEPADPGTLIERNPPEGRNKIKGISSSDKIALLSMVGSGMVGVPGYSSKLFAALANNNINIILITQASSVHTMCIAISEADADTAKKATDELFAYEISLGKVEPLKVEKGFSIISLVGDDMKNQSGASGKMFEALGREGINIRAIAQGSSERNVSTVVKTEDVKNAIRSIHKAFFGKSYKRLNLFVAGYGTVSKALIDIIFRRKEYIENTFGKELVLCGISNSRNFVISRDGIMFPGKSGVTTTPEALSDYLKFILADGEKNADNSYIKKIAAMHMGNSIFVDCTADRSIADSYPDLFKHKFSVVACNKIANSLSYDYYSQLKESTLEEGVTYNYETTVGAALPIVETIRNIVNCGDSVLSFEGILSGTLNYLFSKYDGSKSFAGLVKDARELGYTEPDPRIDLSGTDVFRKLLISAREAGLQIDASDIEFEGFVPESLIKGHGGKFSEEGDEFYSGLEKEEKSIELLYNTAAKEEKKLRFIASFRTGASGSTATDKGFAAKIALEKIGPEHPFYNLEGSDNAVSIVTVFYPQGIVIKGAGAGAKQTAGGLLNDILKN